MEQQFYVQIKRILFEAFPNVLEFLGLNPNDDFYESNLEEELITHLQKFLLELGRGLHLMGGISE